MIFQACWTVSASAKTGGRAKNMQRKPLEGWKSIYSVKGEAGVRLGLSWTGCSISILGQKNMEQVMMMVQTVRPRQIEWAGGGRAVTRSTPWSTQTSSSTSPVTSSRSPPRPAWNCPNIPSSSAWVPSMLMVGPLRRCRGGGITSGASHCSTSQQSPRGSPPLPAAPYTYILTVTGSPACASLDHSWNYIYFRMIFILLHFFSMKSQLTTKCKLPTTFKW